MKIDQKKLRELLLAPAFSPSPDQLRREDNVFLVGGNLPERQTLETLYDSHYQSNAALFHLIFGAVAQFADGEVLARVIKKNFNVHLAGRLDFPASSHLIERAYAAGVDILDIPLFSADMKTEQARERLKALHQARAVFPRWSVVSTLVVGEEPADVTISGIDALLAAEIVPLLVLSEGTVRHPDEELVRIYTHLEAGWRKHRCVLKPLLPLIQLTTPLVPAAPRNMLRGFIDSIEDRRLLAASDLRRVLRVKEVAESFDSAGL